MAILLFTLVLAVVATWLTNGDLRRLEKAPLKHSWMFIVAAAVQIAIFLPGLSERWFGGSIPYLYVASFSLVFLCMLLNLRVAGIPLAALGVGMNLASILANGGYMPVSRAAVATMGGTAGFTPLAGSPDGLVRLNSLLTPDPRLWFLGDIFAMRVGPLRSVLSIGDLVLSAGLFWLLIHYSRRPKGRHRSGRAAKAGQRGGRQAVETAIEDEPSALAGSA